VKTGTRFPTGYLESHRLIVDVDMGTQAAHLFVQVEVNALVPYIDGAGSDHELYSKGLPVFSTGFDEKTLRFGNETMQGGIVRKLEDVLSG
jgi:hypothetical protein